MRINIFLCGIVRAVIVLQLFVKKSYDTLIMRKFSPGGKALRKIMRKVMEMGMMKWVNNFFFVFPHYVMN